jgi:putative sugar O-methyltransferase
MSESLHALQDWRRRYIRSPFANRVFAHRVEYRSDSENGKYGAAVTKALNDQSAFDTFKRKRAYRKILEHVSRTQGQDYLKIVRSREDGLLEAALETVFRSDDVGSPVKYQYEGVEPALSPTTLRYLKVASDLKGLFGEGLDRIAEIGCGYGGQTLVNDQLLNYRYATLFDLPFVNELIRKYLNTMLLNGAYRVTTINETLPANYDLVISNYAFSELPTVLQHAYIRKVLANSERGYLTMNSGLGGRRSSGKLSIEQLQELLPPFEIYEEDPLTSPYNYIIVWGHDKDFATRHMTLKSSDQT